MRCLALSVSGAYHTGRSYSRMCVLTMWCRELTGVVRAGVMLFSLDRDTIAEATHNANSDICQGHTRGSLRSGFVRSRRTTSKIGTARGRSLVGKDFHLWECHPLPWPRKQPAEL